MRRLVIAASVAALVVVSVPGAAGASTSGDTGGSLRRQWIQWAFGDSGAPLLQEDLCGEVVDGVFFMTVAGGSPTSVTRRIDCEIASGVPVLATPGGFIGWAPTDGTTDQRLARTLFDALENLRINSVHLRLDGEEVPHGDLKVSDPYTLPLEPGNLIQTVDPAVVGDSTRVIYGWYFKLIPSLTPGDHVLVATDRFDFRADGGELVRYRTVFTIHVI
jgi:hypothetical protein